MSSENQGLILQLNAVNREFSEKIKELSGENIDLCFQCGACSSGCPMFQEMDYLPSKIVRMVQLGIKDVLVTKTIWVCSTCFNCEVRCPRGIDVANVMEAIRQLVLRQKFDKVKLNELTAEELSELPQIAIVSILRKLTA